MKLTESEAHDLAVAFAATYSKESFKYDPETVLTKLEQELASFEELYIDAIQFFNRDSEY